ncbi:MAG: hypothetical protein ACKO37_07425 [Vampirovibrionales bacterium]
MSNTHRLYVGIVTLGCLLLSGCQEGSKPQQEEGVSSFSSGVPASWRAISSESIMFTLPETKTRPMLWLATSAYCQACHELKSFLAQPAMVSLLKQKNILVREASIQAEDAKPALALFRIQVTPTAVLIAQGGKIQQVFHTVPPVAAFQAWLKAL